MDDGYDPFCSCLECRRVRARIAAKNAPPWESQTIRTIAAKRAINPAPPLEELSDEPAIPLHIGGDFV